VAKSSVLAQESVPIMIGRLSEETLVYPTPFHFPLLLIPWHRAGNENLLPQCTAVEIWQIGKCIDLGFVGHTHGI
jgi:hypothetical protein